MSDLFADLPWFLKEYVHSNRWSSFRSIQTETYELIRNGDSHILISAGTSSGKTEAALFPVISSLYTNPPAGIGALYIGPLKALIDDQFERADYLLGDSGIRVTGWHGDVSQSAKKKLFANPSGILQITPESLQNIISNHPDQLVPMFASLRFVIIDEVHAFMSSDRGLQLLCCLETIERITKCRPRRLGLSATVSDPAPFCKWLSASTGVPTEPVTDGSIGDRELEIRYNLFPTPQEEQGIPRKKAVTAYYRRLYSDIEGRNCIVFTNSRDSAEKTSHSLMKMAELDNRPGTVFIHHGSVSRELRAEAEKALKSDSGKKSVVATVTLELGIDVGNLDRIIQVGAPYTCSSMVQRMGRSGRRGGSQNMVIYCNDDLSRYWAETDGISMDTVRCIAMAELVLKDHWVETPSVPSHPYGLLFHQTLQYLKPRLGAKFAELAENVLSMYPFRNISRDDYKTLIRSMVSSTFLERMEDGTYLIGTKGERMAFHRDFCSVFTVGKEFEIKFEGKSIGSIQQIPSPGELIQLAGRVWEVTEVDMKDYHADVIESDGTVNTPWTSGIPGLDTRILKKMKEVLVTNDDYPYIDQSARDCLRQCRSAGYLQGVGSTFVDRSNGYRIYPWLGSRQFDTLRRILQQVDGIKGMRSRQPYYIDVATDLSESEIRSEVRNILRSRSGISLVVESDDLRIGKYDEYVPESLLIKQFVADEIDTDFDL